MSQAVPPPIPSGTSRKKRGIKITLLILLACLFVLVLFPIAIAAIMQWSMFSLVKQIGGARFQSSSDRFQVTVLELKSESGYFRERIRVRCERDMVASLWVTDLKKVGLFETTGTNGQIYYREGQPREAGSSVPVRAEGGFSTCDIFFSVHTTDVGTAWHDEVAGGTLDTTFSDRLAVNGVETNWPGTFDRGSAIPLANLGDYKILLSVK